jgi:hypothetical protein
MDGYKLRVVALVVLLSGAGAAAQTEIETEGVKPLQRTGSLATCSYAPRAEEKPFFAKLSNKEVVTGSFAAPYDLHARNEQYVSWYGIVRGISKVSGSEGQWQLLVQHKYFDGMTDCHIMLVSMNGGGDFRVRLEAKQLDIPPLALVRVYGMVKQENGTPVISAEFIRVWPWMTFTFTDLGAEDKTNPQWKKVCKICRTARIYRPYPDEKYYREALGDPGEYGRGLH